MEYKEIAPVNAIGPSTYTSHLQSQPADNEAVLHECQLSTGSVLHHSYPQISLFGKPLPQSPSPSQAGEACTGVKQRTDQESFLNPNLIPTPNLNLIPNLTLKTSEQELFQSGSEGDGAWGRGLLKFGESLAGQPHDCRSIIDAWIVFLRSLGCFVQRGYPVFLPPLQKHDRISLYVSSPIRVGIEFDLKAPRAESLLKLQHFDGYRVLVLRQAKHAIYAPQVNLVVPCHCRPVPRDVNDLASPEFLADIKARHAYRDGIDPDHVYYKCQQACLREGNPFTKRRLVKWLENEFLPTRPVAKAKCVVCNMRAPFKGYDRCGECKWKGR